MFGENDSMLFNKNMSDFCNFHRIIILVYGDTSLILSRNFTDLSKNYTHVYITSLFEALSLLVYSRTLIQSAISILYFALSLVPA